jgi:hypothetical protein
MHHSDQPTQTAGTLLTIAHEAATRNWNVTGNRTHNNKQYQPTPTAGALLTIAHEAATRHRNVTRKRPAVIARLVIQIHPPAVAAEQQHAKCLASAAAAAAAAARVWS